MFMNPTKGHQIYKQTLTDIKRENDSNIIIKDFNIHLHQ